MLLTALMSITAFAQKISYKGTVTDQNGDPVIGATVTQKGGDRSSGAITDLDGQFTIEADAGSTLSVSYIGFTTQDVRAAQDMRIVLQESAQSLSDVVVIGYGVQKKSVVTAAIAKVSAEDLANKTPVRIENALKGLAAGVTVTSSSGQPGDAARVQVRGIGTIKDRKSVV